MNDRGINIRQRCWCFARLLAVTALLASSVATAAEDVRVETVLKDLQSPASVAIRRMPGAESYEIFVAEVGAGRVVRLRSDQPNASEDAITGFMASTDEDELSRLPGPHGLLFLDSNRLVVTGDEGEGRPFVRLYELTDASKPLRAEAHEQQAAAAGDEKADDDIASFHGLARTLANDKVPDFLVLSATMKDSAATFWQLPLRGGTLGDLSPFGTTESDAPASAITTEPRGHIIIVRPEVGSKSTSSRIELVNPIDTRTTVTISLKLANITGAACSPRTGNLYAISRAPRDAQRSGVYRVDLDEKIDSKQLSANATFIAAVDRPTALAFGPDGALYVTSLGVGRQGGSLTKISGEL